MWVLDLRLIWIHGWAPGQGVSDKNVLETEVAAHRDNRRAILLGTVVQCCGSVVEGISGHRKHQIPEGGTRLYLQLCHCHHFHWGSPLYLLGSRRRNACDALVPGAQGGLNSGWSLILTHPLDLGQWDSSRSTRIPPWIEWWIFFCLNLTRTKSTKIFITNHSRWLISVFLSKV